MFIVNSNSWLARARAAHISGRPQSPKWHPAVSVFIVTTADLPKALTGLSCPTIKASFDNEAEVVDDLRIDTTGIFEPQNVEVDDPGRPNEQQTTPQVATPNNWALPARLAITARGYRHQRDGRRATCLPKSQNRPPRPARINGGKRRTARNKPVSAQSSHAQQNPARQRRSEHKPNCVQPKKAKCWNRLAATPRLQNSRPKKVATR